MPGEVPCTFVNEYGVLYNLSLARSESQDYFFSAPYQNYYANFCGPTVVTACRGEDAAVCQVRTNIKYLDITLETSIQICRVAYTKLTL
jgi:hypothetical protein